MRASRRLDPARLVFIDETWIKTNMAPIRGWGPKGERLLGFAPDGRWRTLTFLAALRIDALTEPCVVDGPINEHIASLVDGISAKECARYLSNAGYASA